MCLALVALDAHPRFPLVIAANRDEFHAREAAPAHWWPDGTLAGIDRVGGGTWFGVDTRGRWALVTNFREGEPRQRCTRADGGHPRTFQSPARYALAKARAQQSAPGRASRHRRCAPGAAVRAAR